MKVEGRKMISIGDYISRNTRKQNLKKEIENETRR